MVGTEDAIATHYVETKFAESTPSDLAYYLLGSEEDIIPDVFGEGFLLIV